MEHDQHELSLRLAEQCSELMADELTGVVKCAAVSAGLVELILRAGSNPGYGAREWRLFVGGEGVGEDAALAAMLGTPARAPVGVRFDGIHMHGVDDTGLVDDTFWGGLPATPTLHMIAARAVSWLRGEHIGEGIEDEARRAAWNEAQQHACKRQFVIDSFRALAPCKALVVQEAEAWLHPEWLAPTFQSVARRDATATEWAAACEHALASGAVEELSSGVYAFDLFTPTMCEALIAAVDAFEASALPRRRPNSMNKYGLVVNDIGMRPLLSCVLSQLVAPLARRLYPREPFASTLDHHHSFVVVYDAEAPNADVSLDMHHDASEVTLNVCLGRANFRGGDLRFCGQFGSALHRQTLGVVHHGLGRAVLHLGRQRHGAEKLEAGQRLNLILWARSSAFRAAAAFGHIDPDGFPKQPEAGTPDRLCLSKANDEDYEAQLTKVTAPVGRGGKRAREEGLSE